MTWKNKEKMRENGEVLLNIRYSSHDPLHWQLSSWYRVRYLGRSRGQPPRQRQKGIPIPTPPGGSWGKRPFIQAISDVNSLKNSFFDGKLLLIDDTVAGFRPHTAASARQVAFDALMLHGLVLT